MPEQREADKTDTFEPAAETLRGDLRDWLLDRFRILDKPWTKLTEVQQRKLIDSAEEMSRIAVRRALDIATAYPFPTIEVAVGKYTGKDGTLKAEFTCPDTDDNLIHVARAGRAVLVLVDPAEFDSQRAPARVEPDQPGLNLGEGETIDPETGEIIRAGAPAELLALPAPGKAMPLPEAQTAFEAAQAKALEKKRKREEADAAKPPRAPRMPKAPAREPEPA